MGKGSKWYKCVLNGVVIYSYSSTVKIICIEWSFFPNTTVTTMAHFLMALNSNVKLLHLEPLNATCNNRFNETT